MPRGPKMIASEAAVAASVRPSPIVTPVLQPWQPLVIGIDPSATGTGLAALHLDGTLVDTTRLTSSVTGAMRLKKIETDLIDWLGDLPGRPAHFVMEGYAFDAGRAGSQSHKLGEVGGVIKLTLVSIYDHPICFPTLPTTQQVKKFCLGKGTGVSKSEMLKGVYKKWGADLKTDDEADAYTLARIGLGLLNGVELQYEKDVLQSLRFPPKKRKADPDRRPMVWAELPDEERYVFVDPAEYLRTSAA